MKYFSEISLQDTKFQVDFDVNNGFWIEILIKNAEFASKASQNRKGG